MMTSGGRCVAKIHEKKPNTTVAAAIVAASAFDAGVVLATRADLIRRISSANSARSAVVAKNQAIASRSSDTKIALSSATASHAIVGCRGELTATAANAARKAVVQRTCSTWPAVVVGERTWPR